MYYLTAFEIICCYSLSTRWIRSLKCLAKKKIDIRSFETKGNWNNCRLYSVFYKMPRLFSHPQTLSTLCWCFDCTTTRFFVPWCSIDQVVNSCLTHWFDAAFFFHIIIVSLPALVCLWGLLHPPERETIFLSQLKTTCLSCCETQYTTRCQQLTTVPDVTELLILLSAVVKLKVKLCSTLYFRYWMHGLIVY